MTLLRAIRIVRHAAKLVAPYGWVRRLYGREADGRNMLRDALPFFISNRIWGRIAPDMDAIAAHQRTLAARLAEKMASGQPLRVVFFVTNNALFPARALFDAMLDDAAFAPSIAVIPELRWKFDSPYDAMKRCFDELSRTVPRERLAMAVRDGRGHWSEMISGADIVCFPLPYDDIYNPCYSPKRAQKGAFLPICANYGFYRSIYDRTLMASDFYAYMWKAFFECEETLAEYREYSQTKGANAVVTGYIKMDALANECASRPSRSPRKNILVALHHSVEDGTNANLSLANFERYADYFMALPDRFPDIDFTFRPHPFLRKIISNPLRWGAERADAYFAALKAKRNVAFSEGGDYFADFAASDACIQDCGSYLVEYFYTKKPCCYMLKTPDDIERKFAPLGRKCLENCYLSFDASAIDVFIRDVVAGGRDTMKARREAFADTIMVNYPRAAQAALGVIRKSIAESRCS